MSMRALRGSLIASVALLPGSAWAQASATLEEINVVATTPVPSRRVTRVVPVSPVLPAGAQAAGPAVVAPSLQTEVTVTDGVDRNKVAQNTYVLTSQDVNRTGYPSVLRALDERVGSISINNAQGNPFQPAITFRGFEASPLGGSPQGLAVYVNGSRFNTSFGDTVQWDLIPDIAVDRIELEGSNPAFGLNALGGALAVTLKNGFTYQGTEVNLLGGSYGRGAVAFQHGQQIDNVAFYVAGNKLAESGWRKHSPSNLNQLYTDLGVQADKGEFHLNFIGASNNLTGNGTSPVELLQVKYNDVFTYPDATRNDYGRLQLSGTYDIAPTVTLQGNAYYGVFKQRTFNGDAADVENCEANPAFVCSGDDDDQLFLRDLRGNPVRASRIRTFNFGRLNPIFADRYDEGGPYAFLNRTNTDTDNFGTTVQATIREPLPFFAMPNRLVIGASYDGGRTRFSADNQVGGFTFDRGFAGPGITITDGDTITPVSVRASNDYGGIYFSNITDVTDALTLTLQGRYNIASIKLRDQIGTELNGNHLYERFNPGIGAAYKLIPEYLIAYGSYVEANRAPTPAELSCADPGAPCSLTNFFVGDPPLKQVVTRTVEAGLRGRLPVSADFGVWNWKAGYFKARSDDDILFVRSGTIGRAFFRNVGSTQRQGAEVGLSVTTPTWNAFIDYAYVDATFESPLTLNAPGNPFASFPPGEDDEDAAFIRVRPGNRLPGVAPHQVKMGIQYYVTPQWKIGVLARVATGKFLVGDESNLNPTTGAYGVVGVNTSYRVTENIELYGYIENALNTKYSTFGTFSPVDEVPIASVPNASNNRSLAPGMPIAAYGGMRILFAPPPPPMPEVGPIARKG